MQEQLISFETAKLAKEKGCDLDLVVRMDYKYSEEYKKGFFLPTQSLLQKWLREDHNIDVDVWCNASGWGFNLNKTCGTSIYNFDYIEDSASGMFKTYEQALEKGLQEALKLI